MSEFIIVPSEILAVVTALSASFAVLIPKSFTLNGLVVVPNPSIVFMSAIAPNVAESIHATAPVESVTKTELTAPEAIFEGVTAPSASLDVVTFKFKIFEVTTALSVNLEVVTCKSDSLAVVTALSASFEVVTFKSASLAVVTALSANLAVIIPKSFTLNGSDMMPEPTIVVKSATAPNVLRATQATMPILSLIKTLFEPPEAILIGVTAPLIIFAVVIALLDIIGAEAVVPNPPKSPANCIIPVLIVVAFWTFEFAA